MRSTPVVRMLSTLMIGMGIAMVARTVQAGAGASFTIGYLVGGGLIIAGFLRLWLLHAGQRGGES